jgi:hypothetical protein
MMRAPLCLVDGRDDARIIDDMTGLPIALHLGNHSLGARRWQQIGLAAQQHRTECDQEMVAAFAQVDGVMPVRKQARQRTDILQILELADIAPAVPGKAGARLQLSEQRQPRGWYGLCFEYGRHAMCGFPDHAGDRGTTRPAGIVHSPPQAARVAQVA